jgi:MFS family permease
MAAGMNLINATVPPAQIGRVFGVFDSVNSGGYALSFVLAGVLLSSIGVTGTLVIDGVGSVLGALLGLRLINKDQLLSEAALLEREV